MASEYTRYLADLFTKLNETEKKNFLTYIIQHMRDDNKSRLQELPPSKTFALMTKFLEEENLINFGNSDLLISAFESVKRDDLAVLLAFNDMDLNNSGSAKRARYDSLTSKTSSKTTVKINDLLVDLSFKPHKFQLALAQLGCDRVNNVIVVRTGAGKTLISAIICKYWHTFYNKQKKLKKFKVAFIVPTRFLANQQCNTYGKAFDSCLLQEVNDKANEEKIYEYFENKSIIFLTAQKFINTLNKDYFKMADFDIIVFDEVHHCDLLHPYNQIMKIYFTEKLNNSSEKLCPLIIGLTASLGTGDVSQPVKHLIKLCSNLDCKEISCITDEENQADLEKNIPSVLDDKLELISQTNEFSIVQSNIKDCMLKIASTCNIDGFEIRSRNLGKPEFETYLSILREVAAERSDRNEIIGMKYLWELNSIYLKVIDLPISYCTKIMKEFFNESSLISPSPVELVCRKAFKELIDYMSSLKAFTNTKLEKLSSLISSNQEKNSRDSLKYLLKNSKNIVKPVKLTGQGTEESLAMSEEDQKESIEKFRNGQANIMIATDIAQEGLDIPECNYVIRYEFVSNEIGTVQSRGRARAVSGKCFLITNEGSINHIRELENRKKEQSMELALKSLHQMDRQAYNSYYQKFHDDLSQSITKQLSSSESKESKKNFLYDPKQVKLQCRNCSRDLFRGSDLFYREPSYYCTNKNFIENLIIINGAKFNCADKSCNHEIGRLVEIRKSKPMHMIDIKGVKFKFPYSSSATVISKWSRVNQFEINNL